MKKIAILGAGSWGTALAIVLTRSRQPHQISLWARTPELAESLRNQGVTVETAIGHSLSPAKEIVRYANEVHPDLVIMGAHGHGGLKDLIFGNTITPVRHHLSVPMLIVRVK